ncbi:MAG: MoaD/ThiS family protein [Chloroflexota bacterium]
MPTVLLPRSLLALFPGAERRHEVDAEAVADVAAVIDALDRRIPGLRDRLVEEGPRLRPHINVFVAGTPADLATPVRAGDTVHVIPAVSGG